MDTKLRISIIAILFCSLSLCDQDIETINSINKLREEKTLESLEMSEGLNAVALKLAREYAKKDDLAFDPAKKLQIIKEGLNSANLSIDPKNVIDVVLRPKLIQSTVPYVISELQSIEKMKNPLFKENIELFGIGVTKTAESDDWVWVLLFAHREEDKNTDTRKE